MSSNSSRDEPVPSERGPTVSDRVRFWTSAKVWVPLLLTGLALIGISIFAQAWQRVKMLESIEARGGTYRVEPLPYGWLVHLGDISRGFQHVTAVDLSYQAVNDQELSRLTKLYEIDNLWLESSEITDEGLEDLLAFGRLRHLTLAASHKLTDRGLADYFDRAPPLEFVSIHSTLASTLTAQALSQMPSVIHIDAWDTPMTDEGCRHLSRLPHLSTLRLDYTPIGDEGLAVLGEAAQLHRLSLFQTNVGDAGLRGLSRSRSLSVLEVTSPNLTDAGLSDLWQIPTLTELHLDTCGHFTDAGLKHLARIATLQLLQVTACPEITSAGVAHFAGHAELDSLDLTDCSITPDCVDALQLMPSLTMVVLKRNEINQTQADQMRRRLGPGVSLHVH